VDKSHPQIEAIGTFDELNVAIGSAKSLTQDSSVKETLTTIQKALIALMGELACAEEDVARYMASTFPRVADSDLELLDKGVASLETKGLDLQGWATPGANALAAGFDQARVTARRAERRLIGLREHGRAPRSLLVKFTNRLSDYLWLLARQAEQKTP
jgi:cob(I)alamin adenosyltransferase